MARGPLIVLLVIVVALSQIITGLWDYREAPSEVKWAVVAGGVGMAALGVLGLSMLRGRR